MKFGMSRVFYEKVFLEKNLPDRVTPSADTSGQIVGLYNSYAQFSSDLNEIRYEESLL